MQRSHADPEQWISQWGGLLGKPDAITIIGDADAQEKLETWRRHYNEDRPQRAIGI